MLARHNLAWLTAAGWEAGRSNIEPALHSSLEQWQRADWPAIVRRAEPDTKSEHVCLGIALPPDPVTRHKRRIAIHVPLAEISRSGSPLAIGATLGSAPARWQRTLDLLAADATGQGLLLEVYGSLALQALTGNSYITETSDIDILFSPRTRLQLESGIALLQEYATLLPLDGEILFPQGRGVAWKEWIQARHDGSNSRVLVKETARVHLSAMSVLVASLPNSKTLPCAR
jgi:phosphoribosyl-dephospho-CoA transferase